MSDLYSKKAAILAILATPTGGERSNSDIAREVGCEASTVRKVRIETETEVLRNRVAELEAKLARCHCGPGGNTLGQAMENGRQQATQGQAVAARKGPRKGRDDSRPLFEWPGDDGEPVPFVGMLDTIPIR